jgi:hypothetical protein
MNKTKGLKKEIVIQRMKTMDWLLVDLKTNRKTKVEGKYKE